MLRLLLGTILLLCASCAYQFGGVRRTIPGGYDKVVVPVFANKTSEVGVEVYFTGAMIEEIERAQLAHVTSRSDAQVKLEGVVKAIDYVPGAQVTNSASGFSALPDGVVLNKEYRMVVTVDLTLKRISDDKVMWRGQFSGEQRFPAAQVLSLALNSVNPLYNHSIRHQTAKILAGSMMNEAYDRMTENF